MGISTIPFEQTGQFSPIFLDYVRRAEVLQPFYDKHPKPDQILQHVHRRHFPMQHRDVLVKVLQQQYSGLMVSDQTNNNINALGHENAYTITTGHQLNIFTGPLYFIYKIITAINTASQLNGLYPEHRFVPVFWMASEDHDFEEISHFRLFGKQYTWSGDYSGPVGRIHPQGLQEILDSVPDMPGLFREAYLQSDTLATATRHIVNALFGAHGIVVLDADDPDLKRLFTGVMRDDLTAHTAHAQVEKTTKQLAQLDYASQVHPREINLFYMDEGLRSRIIEKDGRYKVLDTEIEFSGEEIKQHLSAFPGKFSPNVILRPVYQEVILPNLTYVGGPAEIAYWLQLKSTFDHFNVPFPVLMPRNFGMIVGKPLIKKMEKLGLKAADLFLDIQEVKNAYIQDNAQHVFTVEEERQEIHAAFKKIQDKAGAIDPTLRGFTGSEEAKTMKSLQHIEKRLKRAVEEHEQTAMQQIDSLYEKLFPEGTPQERTDNFLNFHINDPDFLSDLKSGMDPFDLQYHIFLADD